MFHVEQNDDLQISSQLRDKFEIYKALLFKWQKAVNLVSNNSLEDFWNRHISDSLQIVPYIYGNKVLDVGSGGGFPGMVLAMTGKFNVTCVDSDSRKMTFLSEVARQTNTQVNLINDRIEKIRESNFDTVCARGFSSLKKLLEITLQRGQVGVFLKGLKLSNELEEAQHFFDFQYQIYPSRTDKTGNIIVVSDIGERNKCPQYSI